MSLQSLAKKVVNCRQCPRLVQWREAQDGPKSDYWNRAVPGFGDSKARLLVIGLAPGAHGANRTGRVFTGDFAGEWLYRGLHEWGYSNREESTSRTDSLKLKDAYITNVARCVPPENRPTPQEIRHCSDFLSEELGLLSNLKAVLALGHVAHKAFLGHVRAHSQQRILMKDHPFGHGARHDLGANWPILFNSYHTSRYNVSTRVLKWDMFMDVFEAIQENLDQS